MNAVVVYFSRTGNTKRLAEAIADTAKAPIFELSQAEPSKITAYDLLIFGTPVEEQVPPKKPKHTSPACLQSQLRKRYFSAPTRYLETSAP
jgi:multimeric flavodoxin WrbA